MRAIWKGTISFGLVNIPIALGLATKRSDPSFRTLDRETLRPVKQQLFSPERGEHGETITREETVKGYELSKDRFLPISDEELERVAAERRRSIDILMFVDADEVDPVYFDRTYYLEPQEHAQKAYSLLLRAMKETGKAGVGKIVLQSKEHLALLRPAGDALAIELLFYPEDVRAAEEVEQQVRDVEVGDEELQMATQLVESLARPFEPEQFQNEHKHELLAMIERKVDGEEIPVAAEPGRQEPVPDLMAALRQSIESAHGGGGRSKAGAVSGGGSKGGKGNAGAGGKSKGGKGNGAARSKGSGAARSKGSGSSQNKGSGATAKRKQAASNGSGSSKPSKGKSASKSSKSIGSGRSRTKSPAAKGG